MSKFINNFSVLKKKENDFRPSIILIQKYKDKLQDLESRSKSPKISKNYVYMNTSCTPELKNFRILKNSIIKLHLSKNSALVNSPDISNQKKVRFTSSQLEPLVPTKPALNFSNKSTDWSNLAFSLKNQANLSYSTSIKIRKKVHKMSIHDI